MGYIPFKNLPHVYNPPEGYIISANNKPVPDSYPYSLNFRWKTLPYRAERIKQLLLHNGKLTEKKFETMQLDTKSLFWEDMKTVLLNAEPLDKESHVGKSLLASWNGDMGRDSISATIFEFWVKQLAVLIPKEIRFGDRWLEPLYLKHLLALPRERKFLNESLQQAMRHLVKTYGQNKKNWRWGNVHRAVFNELGVGEAESVAWIWRRSIPTPGGDYTVNVGTFDPDNWNQIVGSSYREIIDLSHLGNSEFMQTLGQSGSPISANYSDLMPMWRNGQYIKMKDLTGRCKFQVNACLILLPLLFWTYNQAESADHLRALESQKQDYELRIRGFTERLHLSQKSAENAMSEAKRRYDAAIAEAEQKARQAESDIEKGRLMQAKALEHAKQSAKVVEKASIEASRATKKKNNAMAAAERIKRREARLRGC